MLLVLIYLYAEIDLMNDFMCVNLVYVRLMPVSLIYFSLMCVSFDPPIL
jgi:hypothetical protein